MKSSLDWFRAAGSWLADGQHWSGADGYLAQLTYHIGLTIVTLLVTAFLAIAVGIPLARTRWADILLSVTSVFRAIPTLGLLVLLALKLGPSNSVGLIVLLFLSIPPTLAGVISGVRSIPLDVELAAQAIGLTRFARWRVVTFPLALPNILAGLRIASLNVIATVTILAYISLGGLGASLFDGIAVRNYAQVMATVLLVAALALLADTMWALLVRFVRKRPEYAAVTS